MFRNPSFPHPSVPSGDRDGVACTALEPIESPVLVPHRNAGVYLKRSYTESPCTARMDSSSRLPRSDARVASSEFVVLGSRVGIRLHIDAAFHRTS
jgi:hypothetical protein